MAMEMIDGRNVQNDTLFAVFTDMVRIVEIGSLWTWGAVVLAMIVAFLSVGVRNIRIVLLRRFLPIRSAMSKSFFIKDEDWDSLSNFSSDDDDISDDEVVSISDEDELVEKRGSIDDEWGWSNKSSVSLSEMGSGRDSVVESWQEQGRDKEVGFVVDRRNRFFEIPTAQIVSAWEDGGQMLRRRVVDLGHRGEEKLIHLRHAYAADLASFVDLKISVAAAAGAAVVDDGGSLEAAVMGWCRNAASCLPLLPASTSK